MNNKDEISFPTDEIESEFERRRQELWLVVLAIVGLIVGFIVFIGWIAEVQMTAGGIE